MSPALGALVQHRSLSSARGSGCQAPGGQAGRCLCQWLDAGSAGRWDEKELGLLPSVMRKLGEMVPRSLLPTAYALWILRHSRE